MEWFVRFRYTLWTRSSSTTVEVGFRSLRNQRRSPHVEFENKDVLFKVLSESYKEKSFSVYGIDLPPIKEVIPTNLPKVSADEKSMDNLFLLNDGTYVIVDYESEYRSQNKVKYLNYVARLIEKYFKNNIDNFKLKIVVIYTGDVEKANAIMETDCLTLRTEQAFLSKINGDEEFKGIREKLNRKESLTDEDVMRLIILPLTQKGQEKKREMVEKVVGLTEEIMDDKQRNFAISGIIVAADKFIDKEYSILIRRRISMTKVGQIIEKEKIEYANEKERSAMRRVATTMLKKEMDIVDIMDVTGFTEEEVLSLQEKWMEDEGLT